MTHDPRRPISARNDSQPNYQQRRRMRWKLAAILFVGIGLTCLGQGAVVPKVVAQGDVRRGGCDLAFLEGPAPTIDGALMPGEWDKASTVESGGCLAALLDGNAGNLSSGLPGHAVKIFTTRSSSNFYIAFSVDDGTNPGGSLLGERIQVLLDPQGIGGGSISPEARRLDFTTTRGTGAGADSVEWYVGGAPWSGPNPPPAGIQVARKNRPSGQTGYAVEMNIPFVSIGYSGANLNDFGIAIAIFNSLGFQIGGSWAFSAVQFPDTNDLKISTAMTTDTPDASDLPNWKEAGKWGSGYLRGAGDDLYFVATPYKWLSDDIKAGFCNTLNFADAGAPRATNLKWYRYYPNSPCPVRLWGRLNRGGNGVGTIARRMLFLWAEHGANPQKWHFIGLTDPVAVGPSGGPGSPAQAIQRLQNDWTNVPGNGTEHPCIRAFILPPDLVVPGFEEAFFRDIGNNDGSNNNQKIVDFMNAYKLTDAHWAQMNIEMITTGGACPMCVPANGRNPNVPKADGDRVLNATGSVRPLFRLEASAASNTAAQQERDDVLLNFEAFGIVPNAKVKYVIIESLGGVAKSISPDFLDRNEELQLKFNVSNETDGLNRQIFVNYTMEGPPELTKRVQVKLDFGSKFFESGQVQGWNGIATILPGPAKPTEPPEPTKASTTAPPPVSTEVPTQVPTQVPTPALPSPGCRARTANAATFDAAGAGSPLATGIDFPILPILSALAVGMVRRYRARSRR